MNSSFAIMYLTSQLNKAINNKKNFSFIKTFKIEGKTVDVKIKGTFDKSKTTKGNVLKKGIDVADAIIDAIGSVVIDNTDTTLSKYWTVVKDNPNTDKDESLYFNLTVDVVLLGV